MFVVFSYEDAFAYGKQPDYGYPISVYEVSADTVDNDLGWTNWYAVAEVEPHEAMLAVLSDDRVLAHAETLEEAMTLLCGNENSVFMEMEKVN